MFDSLGLILPVFVTAKLFLRDLWVQNFNWDTLLDEDCRKRYLSVVSELALLEDLKFPRKVASSDLPQKLIIFCDASKQMYGFCCYVVSEVSGLIFA